MESPSVPKAGAQLFIPALSLWMRSQELLSSLSPPPAPAPYCCWPQSQDGEHPKYQYDP